MFTERTLGDALSTVRTDHAPETLVLDCERDFETLPPDQAEDLGLLVQQLDPVSYPDTWLPPETPEVLQHYASETFTIGMPGDGGVAWTNQTDPPVVICKPRLEGSPESFIDFLIATALVELGLDEPEHFLGFFGEQYPDFQAAADGFLDSVGVYQVAAACYDAYLGRQTRDTFAGWRESAPALFEAWVDAGERLEPRLSELETSLATGQTAFGDAAELACSAIKHAGEIPKPFDALDTQAYADNGPEFAVEWLERTAESLS